MSFLRKAYSVWRDLRRPGVVREVATAPQDLIIFVTDRCNLRCRHCLFRARIDQPVREEIPPDTYRRIAASVSPMRQVVITGGEPLVRDDLADVLRAWLDANRPNQIHLDTNGTLTEQTLELVEHLAPRLGPTTLIVQVSLDGLEATNDYIRGLPGAFKQTCETIRGLTKLGQRFERIKTVSLTVLSEHNWREIRSIFKLMRGLGVDLVGFDLLRGSTFSTWGLSSKWAIKSDPPNSLSPPPRQAFDSIYADLKWVNAQSGYRLNLSTTTVWWEMAMYRGGQAPFRCVSAGRSIGVLYPDGNLAACEFTRAFGNLRQWDWNLSLAWQSREAETARRALTTCHCAHACFLQTSLEQNFRAKIGMIKHI